MGKDWLEIVINVVKMLVIFLVMVQLVPILVWLERRVSAYMQNRFGPNRVGPLGLVQLLADAVKFLFKEPFFPAKGMAVMYYGAPVMALIPGALALAAIPLGLPFHLDAFDWHLFGMDLGHHGPYDLVLQGYDFGVGIVVVLGVSSLGAYSLLMAGWGSSNKYSLLGALRASAQMVSYELALGLSLVGILMIFNTFSFYDIVAQQQGPLTFNFLGAIHSVSWLPNWGIFFNPLGALIFFCASFAETNRLPFDLPEAEGELVAGFHTEYGGFALLMFYIGEYGHMMVASALMATFYFGGFQIPGVANESVIQWVSSGGLADHPNWAAFLTSLVFFVVMLVKIMLFLLIFIWVRWTLPRFRYDQLMDLGWKTMLPWALFNTCVTAVWLVISHKPT